MITITINDDALTAAFARLARALADMSPAMNDIGQALVYSAKRRIDEGVTPEGAAFAPRSQTTLDAYGARNPPVVPVGGPLKLRGDMQEGIFHGYGADYAEVASNAIQAAVMQFGASQGQFGAHVGKDSRGRDHFHTIPWGDIPARPFLGVSDEDRTEIIDIVGEWLLAAAAGSD